MATRSTKKLTEPLSQKHIGPTSFYFTEERAACQLIDRILSPLAPSMATSWIEWTSELETALFTILSPTWDAKNHRSGRPFLLGTLRALGRFLPIARCDESVRSRIGAAAGEAIGRLPRESSKLEGVQKDIEKIFNIASESARTAFGFCGAAKNHQAGASCAALLGGCTSAAEPELLSRMAQRLLPPWQLAADPARFSNAETFVLAYGAMFAAGCPLETVLGAQSSPGKTLSKAVEERMAALPEGPLKALFLTRFERKTLDLAGRGDLARRGVDAWDIAIMPTDKHTKLLEAVALIEEAMPGRGVDEAIERVLTHPAVAAARERRVQALQDENKAAALAAARPARARL